MSAQRGADAFGVHLHDLVGHPGHLRRPGVEGGGPNRPRRCARRRLEEAESGGRGVFQPGLAPADRNGRLSSLATSKMLRPLRRLTVSANRDAGPPSVRRNSSANWVMLLAAAPRQP